MQNVADRMNKCAELLRQRTSSAAISALEIISSVLPMSPYSENFLEMKGEALLMVCFLQLTRIFNYSISFNQLMNSYFLKLWFYISETLFTAFYLIYGGNVTASEVWRGNSTLWADSRYCWKEFFYGSWW